MKLVVFSCLLAYASAACTDSWAINTGSNSACVYGEDWHPEPASALTSTAYLAGLEGHFGCPTGYTGGECTDRICPYGLSWTAQPIAGGSFVDGWGAVQQQKGTGLHSPQGAVDARGGLHTYAECSNQGVCDRATGQCKCFAGYEGQGCRRTVCPNDCSGNGRCVPNEEVNDDYHSKNPFGTQFWDGKKTMACACDRGYTGDDCSARICPHGDDVLTTCGATNNNQVQTITLANMDDSFFTLVFSDSFGGKYETVPIKNDEFVSSRVQEALEGLPNSAVPSVQSSAKSGVVKVTFSDPATSGKQKPLSCRIHTDNNYCGTGQQPAFPKAAKSTATCVTGYDVNTNLEENTECGNRGKCNTATGACDCFAGHAGEACGSQTTFI